MGDDAQIDELRQQFQVSDANGSGFIEKDELKDCLKTLGYQISDEGFENLLITVGSRNDRLNFEEFIAWNRELYKEEMKQEFNAIDTDGSGWISKAELKAYSMRMKYNLTEEQIDDFLYQADVNQNDKIGLDEYISAMVGDKPVCSSGLVGTRLIVQVHVLFIGCITDRKCILYHQRRDVFGKAQGRFQGNGHRR